MNQINVVQTKAWRLLTMIAFAVALVVTPTAAQASPAPHRDAAAAEQGRIETQISAILRLNPGSRRVDTYSVELEPGAIMTISASATGGRAQDVGTLGFGECPWLYVCGWQLAGATGYRLQFTQCDRWYYLENFTMPDGRDWRDKITSIYNAQSGSNATAEFVDTLGNGSWFTVGRIAPGGQRANLALDTAPDGRSWNDRIDKIWACG